MSNLKERWKNTPRWLKIICYVLLGIGGVIVFGFAFGFIIKFLWNWLMPEIFGLKKISYWQAIGIFMLARLVFGSFGGNSSSSKPKNEKKNICEDNEDTKEKYNSTRNYDEWWEAEGKKAFDDYVEKKYNSDKTNETRIGD